MEPTLPPLSNVRDISPSSRFSYLIARVISLWKTPDNYLPRVPFSVEIILVDKEGVKIQASVCKEAGSDVQVEVGFVYKISAFKVIPNNRDLRLTSTGFRLIFTPFTNVFASGDCSIPREAFSFVDTAEIERCRGTFSHLIDFIGLLSAVSPVRRLVYRGKISKMMMIDMMDPAGTLRCCLLGEMVDLLMLHLSSKWVIRPILILQYFQAKYIRGKVIIQNVPHFSNLLIDSGFEAVSPFMRRLFAEGIQIEEPVGFISQPGRQINIRDDMLSIHPRGTIRELNESNENAVSITHAGIESVLREYPWTYPSCICHEELFVRNGVYECVRCERFYYKMLRRYRLHVEAFDGDENAIFFLKDADVKEIIKLAPSDPFSPLDSDVDVDYPLEVVEKVVGRKMLFKVCKLPCVTYKGSPCYEVLRICLDPVIISLFGSEMTSTNVNMVTDFEEKDSVDIVGSGDSSDHSSHPNCVKRKLLVVGKEGTELANYKLRMSESEVVQNMEVTVQNLNNGQDGVLAATNLMKAIKICDDCYLGSGSEDQSSFLTLDGLKLEEEHKHSL